MKKSLRITKRQKELTPEQIEESTKNQPSIKVTVGN